MGIALMLDQGAFSDPHIGLAQLQAGLLGQTHEPFPRPMNELRVGRKHNVLRLRRGVHNYLPRVRRLHRAGLDRHRQTFLQKGLDPFLAHALVPTRH